MKNARNILPYLLFTAILLSSCFGQAPEPTTPTPDVNALMTQSVGTFVAQFFQTQTAMYTPPTPTPLNSPTPIPSNTPLPESELESLQLQEAVQKEILKLPDKYRTAIVLKYMEELSLNEISEILDLPLGTVKTRIHRGREALRQQLRYV